MQRYFINHMTVMHITSRVHMHKVLDAGWCLIVLLAFIV